MLRAVIKAAHIPRIPTYTAQVYTALLISKIDLWSRTTHVFAAAGIYNMIWVYVLYYLYASLVPRAPFVYGTIL